MKKEIRILVLEDFAPDAEIMIHELRRTGYNPAWKRVQTEDEFIRELDAQEWDIILADFTLPQFDAVSALQILNAKNREIPLIIVTGTISEEAALRCIEMGAADYLLKDRLTRLGAAVQHVLEEKILRQDKERTEVQLVESEERFYRLAENATDLFCRLRVSPDLKVDYINPAIIRILGYSPKEIGANPHMIIDRVDPEQRQALVDVFEDRVPFTRPFVFAFEAKDATWHWVECSIVPIRDGNGQLLALEIVGRDVTSRHEAEEALQQSHDQLELRVRERTVELQKANEALRLSDDRFRVALTNSPVVVANTDADLRYTWIYNGDDYVNAKNAIGKKDEDLFPPDDVKELTDLKRDALATKQAIRREVSIKFRDEVRFYDAFVEPLLDPETGTVVGLSSARMDITALKQREHDLYEANQRLSSHASNSAMAMVELDPEMRIVLWNREAERTFGWQAEEVIGRTLEDINLVYEEDIPRVERLLERIRSGRFQKTYFENRNRRKDGTVLYCHWYNSVLLDDQGRIKSLMCLGLDVTEQTLAERSLRDAKQRLTTILESITDAFMSLDRDLRYTYVNRTAAELTRQNVEDMIGRRIWEVFPEAVGTIFQEKYEQSLREQVSLTFEAYYPPLEAWFEVSCYPSAEGLAIFFDDVTDKKRMIERISESEERFRQITENINEIVWMTDVATVECLYISPNYEKILGYPVQEGYEGRFAEHILPEDLEQLRDLNEQLMNGTLNAEFRYRRPDGSLLWLHVRSFPIRNAEGETYRIVGIAEDITERKAYEEERERLASIVNFSQDSISGQTLDGVIISWNVGAEMMYGWSASEIIGRHISVIVPEDRLEEIRQGYEQVMAGQAFSIETVRLHRDGHLIDVLLTLSPIRDASGQIVGISGIAHDITKRRRAQEALRLSEERFSLALSNSPITVFHQDRDLRFVWMHNPAPGMEELLGKTDDEVRGIIDISQLTEKKRQVLLTGNPVRTEFMSEWNGQNVYYDLTFEPMRNTAGEIVGLTGVAVEITQAKQAEAELARRNLVIEQEGQRLRTVLDVLPVAVFIADAAGDLVMINEAGRELWGDPPLVNSTELHVYKGWLPNGHRLGQGEWAMSRALNDGQITLDEEVEIESFNGQRKTILNFAKPILDKESRITGAVAVCLDITERKEITRQLEDLNENLEALVVERTMNLDLLRRIAQIANESEGVDEALRQTLEAVCQRMGWDVGHAFIMRNTDDGDFFADSGIWHFTGDSSRYQRLIELTDERIYRGNGGLLGDVIDTGAPQWVRDVRDSRNFMRNPQGEDLGVAMAMAFPVLIEKRVVAVLEFFCQGFHEPQERQLELMMNVGTQIGRSIERQRLQYELTQAALNEQRRLGHELHDTVGQELAGLAMSTKTLFKHLEREHAPEADMIAQIADQLREAVVHVKAVARGLFPVEVDAEGIRAALVELALQTQKRFAVDCQCHFPTNYTLSDNDAATQLYRIAQEAISNAVRHGGPTKIDITLKTSVRDFLLKIEDNGIGIPAETEGKRSGIGLFIMRHRARMINATLEVESVEGRGVSISCTRGEEFQHDEG